MKDTITLVVTLSASNTTVVKWWIDGSCVIYKDVNSHTDICMSISKEWFYRTSIGQNLNVRISMETELVPANDVMP